MPADRVTPQSPGLDKRKSVMNSQQQQQQQVASRGGSGGDVAEAAPQRTNTGDDRMKDKAKRAASKAALASEVVGKENLKSTLSMGGRQQKKVVAVIGEDTQESFRKRFLAKQIDGTVSLEAFFDILADMQEVYDVDGVVYNAGLVHKMYAGAGDDDNDAMTQRDCLVLIGRFITKCQDHDRRLAAEAAKRKALEGTAAGDTLYVSWWAWVKSRMRCRPKRKGEPTIYWKGITRISEQTSVFLLANMALIVTCCLVIGIEAGSAFSDLRDNADTTVNGIATVLDSLQSNFDDSTVETYRRIIEGLSTKLNPATSALVDSTIALYLKLGHARTLTTVAAANNVAAEAASEALRTLSSPLQFVKQTDATLLSTTDELTTGVFDVVLRSWVALVPTSHRNYIVAYLGDTNVIVASSPTFRTMGTSSLVDAVIAAFAKTKGSLTVAATVLVNKTTLYLTTCTSFTGGTMEATTPSSFGVLVACTFLPRTELLADTTSRLTQFEISGVKPGEVACRVALLDRLSANSTWQWVNKSWTPRGSYTPAPNLGAEFLQASAALGADTATSNVFPTILITPEATPFARYVVPGYGITRYLDYLAVVYLPIQGLSLMGVCAVDDTIPPARFTQGAAAALTDTQVTIAALVNVTSDALRQGQPGVVTSNGVAVPPALYPFSNQAVLGAYAQNGTSQTVYPAVDPTDGTEAVAGYFSAPKLDNTSFTLHLEQYETFLIADEAMTKIFDVIATADSSVTVLSLIDSSDGNLTYMARPSSCPPSRVCSVSAAAYESFYKRRSDGRVAVETGDDGQSYRVTYRYSDGRSAVVGVATRSDATEKLGWIYTGFLMIIGAFVMITMSIAIRQIASTVLDRIRDEYLVYKSQIENEKVQFSELVKDAMPGFIQSRVINGEQLIVDQHPQLTFLFSDIVGCGEMTRNASVIEMVRLLGYTFMLQDAVAEYYHIHKLKTIGDAFFCVAGLEDVARKKELEELKKKLRASGASDVAIADAVLQHEAANKLDSQVLRMVSFAVVVQQLLGVEYVHYPERTECFLESAGQDLGKMNMPSMQMGIHCGNAIAGVVDVGRAPHFDCFGPSVNLSSRMETTAPIDRLQISAPTFELLTHADKGHMFEFDPPKKTLVKGYGTMNTYTIKSTTLRVPEEIIQRVHCERAIRLRHFTEAGIIISTDTGGTTDDGGSVLQPSASSHRMDDLDSTH